MKHAIGLVTTFVVALAISVYFGGCDFSPSRPKASTGVKKITASVRTGADGLTVEQRNVKMRIEAENDPASIKHLYVVSAMSGQCIIYSTVKGKVTSSGKRLTPYSVACAPNGVSGYRWDGFSLDFGGVTHNTGEVLQDDGTYGHSIPYLYWWDSKGIYRQHYVSGGQIVHVSDKPMAFKSIIINLEQR